MHQENPFLKLCPFKLEFLHHDPEIASIHEFISQDEANDLISVARGKTKSTPYFENGKDNGFSKKRTSKVMYMNELLIPEAGKISEKIEMVTKLHLKTDQYASENYQVMNYGIGGKISYHADTLPIKFGNKGRPPCAHCARNLADLNLKAEFGLKPRKFIILSITYT